MGALGCAEEKAGGCDEQGAPTVSQPTDTNTCGTAAPWKRELRAHLPTHLIQNGSFSADVHRSQTGEIPPPASVLGFSWQRALV